MRWKAERRRRREAKRRETKKRARETGEERGGRGAWGLGERKVRFPKDEFCI